MKHRRIEVTSNFDKKLSISFIQDNDSLWGCYTLSYWNEYIKTDKDFSVLEVMEIISRYKKMNCNVTYLLF